MFTGSFFIINMINSLFWCVLKQFHRRNPGDAPGVYFYIFPSASSVWCLSIKGHYIDSTNGMDKCFSGGQYLGQH
jgi:hypothetical protein